MAAKANSQPRQWAKPRFMVMRDRLRMQAGIRKRPVKWGALSRWCWCVHGWAPGDRSCARSKRAKGSVPHIYTKRVTPYYFRVIWDTLLRGSFFGAFLGGLPGIGPALAGNVGASWAFALARDGNQDVDVPMLAPARSHCCFVFSRPGLISASRRINRCRLWGFCRLVRRMGRVRSGWVWKRE